MSRLRSRPAVIVTVLAGVGLAVLAGGRPWVEQAVTGVPGVTRVTATGGQAAPAVTALALVAAAGVVALALTGRLARRVVAGLLVLAGLGMIVLVVMVLQDPAQSVAPALRTATGRTGDGAGSSAVGAPALTGWPWLAAAGGSLAVLGGVVGLFAGRGWGDPARRFEMAAATPGDHAREAVAAGEAAPGEAAPGEAAPGEAVAGEAVADGNADGRQAQRARARRDQALDDWDALSRGEDPTLG